MECVVDMLSGRSSAGMELRAAAPAVPSLFVARPRISGLLDRAVRRPVTLISAGPGYGKTLALAHWIRHGDRPGPVAWLSVSPVDDSVPGFWAGLLAAVRSSGAVPAGSELAGLSPAANFGIGDAARVVDELAALAQPLVIVLDDVQHLRDRVVLDSVELLLAAPPSVRLVLSTRFDPPLRLRRLTVAHALTEIRSADLAFQPAEARELLTASGFDLPAHTVDMLVERTQGWVAGLRLAQMSFDPRAPQAAVTRMHGSDRPIAEYLLQEVLNQLPAEDRQFLLRASTADPVTADLVEAVTGQPGAQSRLERLEAHNAFLVGLAGGRTWFTWHPLFRELLQHQLNVDEPKEVITGLHQRAAHWLAHRGDHIAAIHHLTEAQDWPQIGRMITQRAAPDVVAAQGSALVQALEPAAAHSRLEPTWATLLASALCNFRRFDYAAMLRDTDSAAAAVPDLASADMRDVHLLILALRMAHARARAPRHLVTAAEHVLHHTESVPRHRIPAVERYRAIARANLGIGLLWNGDLDRAETVLDDAVESCGRWDLGLPQLTAMGHLAIADAMRGHLARAHTRAEHARSVADRHGWQPEPQAASHLVALVWAAVDAGRLDEAEELLATARGGRPDAAGAVGFGVLSVHVAVARGDGPTAQRRAGGLVGISSRTSGLTPMLSGWVRITAAEAELAAGRPAAARHILPILPTEPITGFLTAWHEVTIGHCLFAEGDHAGAAAWLTERLDGLDRFPAAAIRARVLLALAHQRQRRDGHALRSISDAIDLAARHGIRRPFLPSNDEMRSLLDRHKALIARHHDFVAALTDRTSTPSTHPTLVDTLTDRERVVLDYLPTHMKSGEIAADLFLSVNTVKSHMQAIYRKLGVSSRGEAVVRARDISLL
jgi:LuxR family maltose regulon positive regulatory protein